MAGDLRGYRKCAHVQAAINKRNQGVFSQ